MKGFASIEKDGHAGELGSTGIRMGEDKYQVSRGSGPGAGLQLHPPVGGWWDSPAQQHNSRQAFIGRVVCRCAKACFGRHNNSCCRPLYSHRGIHGQSAPV